MANRNLTGLFNRGGTQGTGDLAGTAFLINARRAERGLDPLPGLAEDGTLDPKSHLAAAAVQYHRRRHIEVLRKGSRAEGRAEKLAAGTTVRNVHTGGAPGSGVRDGENDGPQENPSEPRSSVTPARRVEALDAASHILSNLPPSQAKAVRIAACGLEGAAKAQAWALEAPTLADLHALPPAPPMSPDAVRKATAACRQALAKARRKMAEMCRDGGALDGLGLGFILGKGSGRRVTA